MATQLSDGGSALYFYGVSRGDAPGLKRALRGIDAIGAVENCPCSGLTCWYSRVDRGEYGERLEQNMQNLEWLANASVHHQRVVGSLSEITAILPARFGTVFLGERSMAADVAERKPSLVRALKRIEGASEWGVKVFAETPVAEAPAPATSGTDYLLKKREQLRQRAEPTAPAEIGEMKAALDRASVAAVTVRGKTPQPGLVWQASFLVKRDREDAFHEVLRKFAARMKLARIETSGPWPPYSFAGVPEETKPGERKQARSAKTPRPSARVKPRPGGKSKSKTRASRSRPHR
jgi:hypothetical protein